MNRAFTLVEMLIVVAVVAIIAAFLWPVFERMRGSRYKTDCTSNLKIIGIGILQYVRDYDEKYPLANSTKSTGWADLVLPWIKSKQAFQCPASFATPIKFSTDYFYNRHLARLQITKVKNPALTIMAGDGDNDAPTWNSWTRLPANAKTNFSSPSQRHFGGALYCFADSHVTWLAPGSISSAPSKATPTFAVR